MSALILLLNWRPHNALQTSEKKMLAKEIQTKKEGQQKEVQDADDEVIYRIDIPANRYDMLCLEGIARALNVFRGKQKCVQYKLADMKGKSLGLSFHADLQGKPSVSQFLSFQCNILPSWTELKS